jgi:chemotaxis protein MotB
VRKVSVALVCLIVMGSVFVSGCAVNFYKQNPRSKQKIETLKSQVNELEKLRAEEQNKFEDVKRMLESKLRGEIQDKQVSLKMEDGALIIVLSDNILFDSGKAELKDGSHELLNNVSNIIDRELSDKNIGIGGHTDNVPITHSSWKSNWELSTARATNVLHYLEEWGVAANRLSATGYGEYRPVVSNATKEGCSENRRVEIMILPEYVLVKDDAEMGQVK